MTKKLVSETITATATTTTATKGNNIIYFFFNFLQHWKKIDTTLQHSNVVMLSNVVFSPTRFLENFFLEIWKTNLTFWKKATLTNSFTNISRRKTNFSKKAFFWIAIFFTVLSIWEIQNKYYIHNIFFKKIIDSYTEIRENMTWAWPLNSISASPISLLNTIYGTIFGACSRIWTELGVPSVTFIAVYVIINLKWEWTILKPIKFSVKKSSLTDWIFSPFQTGFLLPVN